MPDWGVIIAAVGLVILVLSSVGGLVWRLSRIDLALRIARRWMRPARKSLPCRPSQALSKSARASSKPVAVPARCSPALQPG